MLPRVCERKEHAYHPLEEVCGACAAECIAEAERVAVAELAEAARAVVEVVNLLFTAVCPFEPQQRALEAILARLASAGPEVK